MGVLSGSVDTLEPSWSWKGDWEEEHFWDNDGVSARKRSRTAGAEATLTFTGSAVQLIGNLTQDGGRADVYLDGEKAGEFDAWIPERTHDNALWHTYGLTPGRHVLRIVTREDAHAQSKGRNVVITRALIFRAE
jgi:hypothetical protein